MRIPSKTLLKLLGYEVGRGGKIAPSLNQLAVLSLEDAGDGGVLRIHGDAEGFFFAGDQLTKELPLSFPTKLTPKYVYFEGPAGDFRVPANEFVENTLYAIVEFNKLVTRRMAG